MKNKKTLAAAVITIFFLAAISPFAYKAIKEFAENKALEKAYNEYMETNNTFFPGSTLNGEDISGKTCEEVLNIFKNKFNDRFVTIESPRTKDTNLFSFADLNIDYASFENFLNDCYSGQSFTIEEFAAPELVTDKEYVYNPIKDVDFSKADFSKIPYLDSTVYEGPKNASVFVNVKTGETTITEASKGALADETKLTDKLKAAIAGGEDLVTLEEEDFVTPEITSDSPELVVTKNYYNTILNKEISLGVCGLSEYLDSERVRSFLSYDDELVVNRAAVESYVDYLKNTYDSYNKIYTFNTSMGYPVNLDYGNYGWTIDRDATIDAISASLLKNESLSETECAYINTCSRPTNNLQGNSYFEVSLTYQKVWLYIDGQLIITDDCTTGDITNPASATFPGFFHVSQKTTECYLKGPTWYDFVHYWVLFDDPHANGFHDATWREPHEFGGENRNGNGSHGCVNLRLETADVVFPLITFDMPVIVW